MRKLIFILSLFLSLTLNAQTFKPFSSSYWEDDKWWGKDKAEHALACSFISFISGAFIEEGFNFKYGYESGIIVALSIGIWKEYADEKPSYKDLSYDVLGAFIGYAGNRLLEKKFKKKSPVSVIVTNNNVSLIFTIFV